MIVWLCEGCIKARGGPERIGEEVTAGRLFGACSDCGAAWCLWCRTPEESKRRPHRSCPMSGARVVAPSSLRPFRLPSIEHDAPTVPDLEAAARAASDAGAGFTLERTTDTARAGGMLLVKDQCGAPTEGGPCELSAPHRGPHAWGWKGLP